MLNIACAFHDICVEVKEQHLRVSSSTIWVTGIELKLSGLVASAFPLLLRYLADPGFTSLSDCKNLQCRLELTGFSGKR